MARTVRDAMTASVRTATPSQSLTEAARIMKSEHVGSVPVVEGRRLLGMITDRDIVMRTVAEDIDPKTLNVGEVATADLVTVSPEEDLEEALALMAHHRVRRLPVVDAGRLVGILSQADVALEAPDERAGAVLEEISAPSSRERE